MTVNADRQNLRAESGDLSFVEIEYRDTQGTLDFSARHTVTLRAEGGIELLGSGSADPKTEESYLSGTHRVFEGRVLAVVRSCSAGEGRLTVTDEEGHEAEIAYTIE